MKIPMHIECIGDWEGAGMSLDEPGGGLEVYQTPGKLVNMVNMVHIIIIN